MSWTTAGRGKSYSDENEIDTLMGGNGNRWRCIEVIGRDEKGGSWVVEGFLEGLGVKALFGDVS